MRSSLIRLAAARPELRIHLLPLLRSARAEVMTYGNRVDVMTYGNKDRHGSFFLSAFAFGSTGPEDDEKFLKVLAEETLDVSRDRRVKPRLTNSKDGVLMVWWGGDTSFSSPGAMDDDDMDSGAYWDFEALMGEAFEATARRLGILRTKKVDHAAYVKATA